MSLHFIRVLLRFLLVLALSVFGMLEVGLLPARADVKLYTDYSFAADHTCAVLLSGNVECWGSNSDGQLGLGYRSNPILQPQLVPNVSNAKSVEVARGISCAVLTDGNVKCWGGGWYYINAWDVGSSYSAIAVSGLSNVTDLMLSESNGCAYMSSGQAKCWGNNTSGTVGVGYMTSWVHLPLKPTSVDWAASLPQINVNYGSMCSVSVSADLFCWGNNDFGQLGFGTRTSVAYPAQVPGMSNIVDVAVGLQRTCALVGTGQVFCTGSNDRGGSLGLGFASYSGFETTFQQVPSVSNAINIEGGFGNFCAQLVTKQVMCWGHDFGNTPLLIDALAGLEQLKFTDNRICGLDIGGIVHCVGASWYGDSPEGLRIIAKPSGEIRITGVSVDERKLRICFSLVGESVESTPENFEYTLDDGFTWTRSEVEQNARLLEIQNVDSGMDYEIRIRASNSAGVGAPSDAVLISTPPIPVITSVIAKTRRATITFGAPSFAGKSVITDYLVQYRAVNATNWSTFAHEPSATNLSYTITGLTNGVSYEFRVSALNDAGVGQASATASAQPIKATPSVSMNPTASDIEVGRTLSASALTSGSVSTSGTWSWLNPSLTPGRGTSSQVAVFTPTDSENYESVQVSISVKAMLPLRPAIAAVTSDNGSITATIAPARGITARTITGYQYSLDGGQSIFDAELSGRSFTISDLVNGKQVSVQVRAVNADGVSPWSSAKTAIPATTPDAPQITFVRAGMNSVLVHFVAPNTSGARIRSFHYSLDGGQSWQAPSIPAQLSPIKITGLTRKTDYQIQVRSINIKGAGEGSNIVNVRTANCSMSQCTKFYLPQ